MAILSVKSLQQQVYEYLRDEISARRILPNATLNLNQISKKLGVSRTPLRDALIRLETEGLVTIMPRKGVVVRELTLKEVRNYYQICGALEGEAIKSVFHSLESSQLQVMRRLNQKMLTALDEDQKDIYYQLNIEFHDVFLNLSDNDLIRPLTLAAKRRLYDFQRLPYIKKWEMRNIEEHDRFIEHVANKDMQAAVHLMRDVHWSFDVQEEYIHAFYFQNKGSENASYGIPTGTKSKKDYNNIRN